MLSIAQELTIVTKFNNTPVKAGDKLAGMRCIPLLLEEQQVEAVKKIANGEPLLHVKPFVRKTMGIVTTGSKYLKVALKMLSHQSLKNVVLIWCYKGSSRNCNG